MMIGLKKTVVFLYRFTPKKIPNKAIKAGRLRLGNVFAVVRIHVLSILQDRQLSGVEPRESPGAPKMRKKLQQQRT